MLTAVQSLRRSVSRAPCATALAFELLIAVATACMTQSASIDRSQRTDLPHASARITNVSRASYDAAGGSGRVRCASDEPGEPSAMGGDSSSGGLNGVVDVCEDADGEDFDRRARGAAVGSALLHSACEDAPFDDSLRSLREDRRRTRPPNA